MLKIKDNVDLKELEKFGYVERNGYMKIIDIDEITKNCFLYVGNGASIIYTIPRTLYVVTPFSISLINDTTQYLINDLINADLVEKVDD